MKGVKGKQFFKRIAIFLIGILVFESFSQLFAEVSFAAVHSNVEEEQCMKVDTTEAAYLSSNCSGVNYGDQIMSLSGLTKEQREEAKALYDALTTITPKNNNVNINFLNGYSFKSAAEKATTEEKKIARTYIGKITQTAVDAFLYDYPEVFWLDISNSEWSYYFYRENKGNYYLQHVTGLEYEFAVSNQYANPSTFKTKLDQAVAQFPVKGNTRYEKLKSIHDELCKRTTYKNVTYSHEAYGPLVNGKGVCEGYAKAFKLICDRENIPCVLVSGDSINYSGVSEAHMWNYVQMEDGKWYAVDVTWDDMESKIFYDYFLVGLNTKAPNFRNDTFVKSHMEDGDFSATGKAKFTYPVISTTAYDKNAAVVPTSSPKPTATPKPTPTPEPKPARPLPDNTYLYGDADLNDVVEAPDALLILKAVVKLETFDETLQIVSDVDNDWKVGANDALYVLKKVVKLIELFPVQEVETNPTETIVPTATPVPTEIPTPVPTATPTPVPTKVPFSGTLYIAGDSIADGVDVENFDGDPIGWGDIIYTNYTSDVTVNNQAHAGDSALSFYYDYDGDGDGDGHRYKRIYDNIKANDCVIISFGHNDANPAKNRYASPTEGSNVKGSFKWYLKEKFIDPALKVGAVPILMTSVVRCTYVDGKFTETATHLQYGQAMRELVAEYAEKGITVYLIDAQQFTYDTYSNLTFEEAKKIHPLDKSGNLDITHYNEEGAHWMADYISGELEKYSLGINDYLVK